ncbi:MAG: hypothetical protein K9M97_11415, partial [Akkermansiaceae bacterium]|nr:hypothetical protein [Akkermansiaceae bacterium]
MTPPPIPTPSAPPEKVILQDFPDRLSPILVKELRQGLRQPAFLIAFLCLQVLMCIVVLTAAAAHRGPTEDSAAGVMVSGFFFGLLGIVLLVVQPLRGLNALASEIKNDTLDLLLLTRLNAWRITSGKWFALVSQSALLVVAVLPYLIMRYYLGGMQLFSELLGLGFLFLVSASVTAMMVGFSATPSVLLRGLVAAGLVVFLLVSMQGFSVFYMFRRMGGLFSVLSPSTADQYRSLAAVILMFVFCGYYLLEMGATNISPAAENRSTMKRTVGLVMLGTLYFLVPDLTGMLISFWMIVVILLVIDAVSERSEFTASVLRPFHRLGTAGRIGGWFLLPGWPNGLLYVLLLGVATMLMTATELLVSVDVDESAAVVAACFAILLLPAAIRVVFMQRMRNPFAAYIIALMGSLVVGIVLLSLVAATGGREGVLPLILLSPICGFLMLGGNEYTGGVLALESRGAMIYWGVAMLCAAPHRERVAALYR